MFSKALVSLEARLAAAAVLTLSAREKEDSQTTPPSSSNSKPKPPVDAKENAVNRCIKMVRKKMIEIGAPGMVVGVSVNGKNIWTRGFGYADIENGVRCKPETIMRIASISKSITMAAVGKLIEDGKLDLDKSVQSYVPEFPDKKFGNKKVTITTRMLLSHLSGVRHYKKIKNGDEKEVSEYEKEEYYSTKPYKSVLEALDMFKDDELLHEPGSKYLYTTHGWTLVSAVVEKAAEEDFVVYMKKMFNTFGLVSTSPESATDIIYNRARHYTRNKKGRLVNVPYVDNSYKWAGGGFISNVPDLLKFANIMLYSYQNSDDSELTPKGFLKRKFVQDMWRSALPESEFGSDKESYGMGWFVHPEVNEIACGKQRDLEVGHTGGAIGASSILYICPASGIDVMKPPRGVVVAILTNLQSVNLTELARAIASEFKVFASENDATSLIL